MSSLPPTEPERTVPLKTFSAALDEIYMLRSILADDADIIAAHMDFKTFPKSRREIGRRQVERMRIAARGDWPLAVRKIWFPKNALLNAGASDTMTRHQWEKQRGIGGDA